MSRAMGALLAALMAMPSPAGAADAAADDAYRNAREAYARGDYDVALAELRRAHAIEPEPLYVYNMGRALEALGRFREAHLTYLSVPGISTADAALRDLARDRIDALAGLVGRAMVVFDAPQGSRVQVDDALVEVGTEKLLEKGPYLVCRIDHGDRAARCVRASFKLGERTRYAVAEASPSGRVVVTGAPEQLEVDGHPLLVELAKLQHVDLDPGTVELGAIHAGRRAGPRRVVLMPGSEILLHALWTPEAPLPEGPPAGPIALGVAGAAVLLVGGGLLAAGGAYSGEIAAAKADGTGYVVSMTQVRAQETADLAERLTVAGAVAAGVGVAAGVVAILWGVLGDTPASTAGAGSTAWSVRPWASGGASIGLTF